LSIKVFAIVTSFWFGVIDTYSIVDSLPYVKSKKKPHHISMAGLEELKVSPVLNDTT
jgi:uncharacterized OB-fold protein